MSEPAKRDRNPFTSDPFAPGRAELDPSGDEARRTFAAQSPAGLRVDVDTCFSGEPGAKGVKKNRARIELLEHAAPVLVRVVGPDDRVKMIAAGREQIWWEMYAAGQWAALMNRSMIVVTERKMIIIRCDRRSKPATYANQLPFGAVKKVSGFLATLTVKLAKGSRTFQLERGDRKDLAALIPASERTASGEVEYLCPACFASATTREDRCPACSAELASPSTAFRRSLMVPGLGAWHLGFRGFATIQMIRAAVLWIMTAVFFVMGRGGDDGGYAAAAVILVITLFVHLTDALTSRAQARRGMIALDAKLPSEGAPRAT